MCYIMGQIWAQGSVSLDTRKGKNSVLDVPYYQNILILMILKRFLLVFIIYQLQPDESAATIKLSSLDLYSLLV